MGLTPAFSPGDIVKIDCPGHRVHGHLGVVISGPGEFMFTYTVEVAGTIYGFVPSELTRVQAAAVPPAPDMEAWEYNAVMEALMATPGTNTLLVAESIRKKFGASARRKREA